jgi:fructose-1,6-bisphosphatase I
MYPHLNGHPNGKLRLSFELNPMAFLVEQAGGAASDGHGPILDRIPKGKDDRAPIFIGCKEEVALAEEYIARMEE